MRTASRFIRSVVLALVITEGALGSLNDAFANATDLGSVADSVTAYDGRDATRQVGEPSHSSNTSTGTLWWRWTAPTSGQIRLKSVVGEVDDSSIRAVYTGSILSGLVKVAEAYSSSYLLVPVTAGTTYQIAVANSDASALKLEFHPLPPNDAFESRIDIGNSLDFTVDGSTVGATLQSGEPGETSQGPSIWWSWQAPFDGLVSYDLSGSESGSWNTGVYSGTTVTALTQRLRRTSIQPASAPGVFSVKAGDSLAIVVSGSGIGTVGKVRVNWHLTPQPAHTTSQDAVDLGTVSSATGSADNRIVGKDPWYAKLWWRWTPPADGVFRWTATRSDGDPDQPTLRAYDVNLQQLSQHLKWNAYLCRAGQPCLLSLETPSYDVGVFQYQLTFEPADSNDALASPKPLAMGVNPFNTTYSRIEAGEPVISGYTWGRSLWWEWTSPGDGALWLDSDLISPQVGVWGLNPVLPGVRSPSGSKRLLVSTTAGSVKRIGILESDTSDASPGKLTARYIPKTTGNDAFTNAADLGSAWVVAGYGDPAGATREAGEPSPVSYGGSVWWKWTAPGTGNVRLHRAAADTGSTDGLWLYRGSGIGSLVPVTGTAVTAGETLWVAVTGSGSGSYNPIAFELSAVPTHPNDAFAAATDLGGITPWQPSFYLDATSEAGEPIPQRSLWWKWTAPEAGNVFFSVPTGNALCSVYQGTSLANLVLVANSSDSAGGRFIATAGATYWVAVSGNSAASPVTVDWRLAAPPPGDWFAAPVELGQLTSFALETAVGALLEPIEAGLFSSSYNQSLWWRWTAPADGKLVVKASWSNSWLLYEETGVPGAGLTPVTNENVLAGHHYRIANIKGPYTFTSPAAWTFHAIPSNDVYSGAIDLGNSTAVVAETDLYAATIDAVETSALATPSYPPTHGVWWQWTAPFDGVLQCEGEIISNTSSNASLAVVRGNDPLTWQVVSRASATSSDSVVALASVRAGNTYRILLGTASYSADLATLTLSAWPAASNDGWTDATDLGTQVAADARGDNTGTIRESFEDDYGSGSVWWKWTAPTLGNASVVARIGGDSVQLNVYHLTGGVLVPVPAAVADNAFGKGAFVSFRAEPGRSYWISVAGADTETVGLVELAVRLTSIPANDDFANRTVLPQQLPLTFSGNTSGATVEPGEVTYDSSTGMTRNKSLWWSWTAPASGPVKMETSGGNIIHVQTGSTVEALTTVARGGGGSQVAWAAVAGVTYHFVAGIDGHEGAPFECTLASFTPSTNNQFAARISLGSVAEGQWEISTLLGTAEAGEPAHGGQSAKYSIWYEWTAPATGGVLLEAALSGFQARLGVYTGNAVESLQSVAGGQWKVTFNAVAGQSYKIAVDNVVGVGTLVLKSPGVPPNDLFANRTLVTGWPLPIKGSTVLAGAETGEPGNTNPNLSLRTVWWEWVAPANASYRIERMVGSSAELVIYSSTAPATGFSSLSSVTVVSNGSGSFSAIAGRRYYFRVSTLSTQSAGEDFDFRIDTSQGVPPSPPNDDFANRRDIGNAVGILSSGDLYGATREVWETIASNQVSLWWSWTAPADGIFGIRRRNFQSMTTTIFTGSTSASLVVVATGSGTDEWFRVVAGTTYQIRISSSAPFSALSSRHVSWELVAGVPPGNDHFASATVLPDPGGASVAGYNAGASAEGGEPAHSGAVASASVWYQWTANVAGPIQITATSAVMRAAVYQGASLGSLNQVAAGNTTLTFTAVLGETYRIALDSTSDESFLVRLSLAPPVMTNDAFANAIPLSGATVELAGTTVGMTLEAGEPYHTGSSSQGGSAWWTWTAPATGGMDVTVTSGSPYYSIYQGGALDALSLVVTDDDSGRFQATAGTTYRIAVSTLSSTGSSFALKIEQGGDAPSNDGFADAQTLGSQTTVAGTLAGASREAGEPWHGGSQIGPSVWYRWVAPSHGHARVAVQSVNPVRLVVYRGASLGSLVPVVESYGDAGFPVAAGQEFRFVVGHASGNTPGAFEISIGMTDTGGNDAFANRINLGAVAQVAWNGTMEDASIEAGETPFESSGRGSRWWTWTAPADGSAILRLGSGRIVPTAYVYTGTQWGSLSALTNSYNGNGVAFPVRAGTVYQIALRGQPTTSGIGDFSAEFSLNSVPNNNQAAAIPLDSALPVSGSALLAAATSELGESAGSGSVWWRWTAPASGLVDVDTSASDVSNSLAVMTGSGLPWWESVPVTTEGNDVKRFAAVAGTTYWISLENNQSTVFGTVRLVLRWTVFPPNDMFVNALPLTGETFSVNSWTYDATTEPGEPYPRSRPYTTTYHRSLWWKWVAPRSGLLRVNVSNVNSGWAFLYEGATWQALREVTGPGGATSTASAYWVEAGREYYLSAGNSRGGPVTVAFTMSAAGDRFDDANSLAGKWVKHSGSLAGYFWEPGEPMHVASAAQASMWFRWVASANAAYRVTVKSGVNNLRTAAYSGDSIYALRECGSGWGGFVFTAEAGREYRIAVDGGSSPGNFELVLSEEIPVYSVWRDVHFNSMDPASAPDADADHDGLVNLVEASLGSDPLAFTPGPVFTMDSEQDQVRLNLRRPAGMTGWAHSFDLSPTLDDWKSSTSLNRSETVETHGDGTETLRVILHDYRVVDHSRLFSRLRVEPQSDP